MYGNRLGGGKPPLTAAAAQELAEATEPDHAAAEAADLFYFGMVKLVAAGASLAQARWLAASLPWRPLGSIILEISLY